METLPFSLNTLLFAGLTSLFDYLAAHVLLCLIPAFIIAGFMSALIPKETITHYLGPRSAKWISYPAAALGGFVLAVCSCTILPLFAGIWKRGAGLGPAVTFLFVGPAINILAITYTGAAIGFDIAMWRLILSIFFGISIGLLMARIFRKEELEAINNANAVQNSPFNQKSTLKPAVAAVFLLLFAMLIAGTLQVNLFTAPLTTIQLPLLVPPSLASLLVTLNVTWQGALLVIMLFLIAITSWKGFNQIHEGFTGWSYAAIALISVTILLAAPQVAQGSALAMTFNGRFFAELILLIAILIVSVRNFSKDELTAWIWETWKFVKQIFPLLLVGVFAAGIVREIIPSNWIQTIAGKNTLLANMAGVIFGVFMYFPTLVEVPIAKMFLDLGMARGPLLAYLLADPELSIQSILVLNGVMGKKKTGVYVGLVALFSTMAGYLFGIITSLIR